MAEKTLHVLERAGWIRRTERGKCVCTNADDVQVDDRVQGSKIIEGTPEWSVDPELLFIMKFVSGRKQDVRDIFMLAGAATVFDLDIRALMRNADVYAG